MKEVEGERKIIIMRKEFVICLIIIALIAIGNFFSRDYTKKSGEEILDSLQQIKQAVEAKEDDVKVKEKLEETEKIWKNKQDKLAYFIEHNELEKIDTNLVLLKSYIETEEHDETIREINELAFLVKHIEEKYAFNLKNIFWLKNWYILWHRDYKIYQFINIKKTLGKLFITFLGSLRNLRNSNLFYGTLPLKMNSFHKTT